MKFMILVFGILSSVNSVAQANDTVYGWYIDCQGAGVKLHVEQADDDAVVSAMGALQIENADVGSPSTYSKNAKSIQFQDSSRGFELTVIRFNPVGVGSGEAFLKSETVNAKLGCKIGYVPYENGPICFSDASLSDSDCQ